jgi:hypothetical protein
MITDLMTIEEALHDFYIQYLKWAEDGARNSYFKRTVGLCSNVAHHAGRGALNLMKAQFVNAGLHPEFPFNDDEDSYFDDYGNHHLNQRRMDWVRAHAHA